MWIGRILLVGVGSSYVARWVLSPQRHRNYVAGWLKALRKTTSWLPPWRHRIRRFGRRTFIATLNGNTPICHLGDLSTYPTSTPQGLNHLESSE
mgnify:FL=1